MSVCGREEPAASTWANRPTDTAATRRTRDHWILDEEAAQVVKLIFDLCIDGKGPEQIARILEEKQILTTRALYAKRKKKPMPERPYHWGNQSIVAILERQEYTGCTCNFKTYSKSYKLKKRIPNEPEDMFYLPDTQKAIVSQAQFDRVQELRKNKRRPVKAERQGLFSGLLFCADCGSKLHFATSKRFEGKQDRYVCRHYEKQSWHLHRALYPGRMCFVKSFWNASVWSTSISAMM
ncbi:MAG: recombinase family protein [Acutalibacteraceae bacterium]